jgi:hypothetical protein
MATITREQLFAPEDVDNAAADTLITVPSTPTTSLLINGRVRFTNHTAGAVTITAWAVPSGGSAGNTNIALPVTSVGANSYLDVDVPQIAAGGTFEAQAGAATSITAQALDGAYYAT